jgi:hypothetical protein
MEFDRNKLEILPLISRQSKSFIENIAISPDSFVETKNLENITRISETIIQARKNKKPVILAFGAHLIKNGLSLVLRRLIEEGYVTHLATNGAGSIHDWENAFQGKTEEDVKKNIEQGQFGIWEETGKYINLALISGAFNGKGYGEAISEMIYRERIIVPEIKNEKLEKLGIKSGEIKINHLFKRYSVQDAAFAKGIPFTVHPGFGYDIIYTHPLSDGASIGKAAEIDFLKFADSVSDLEGGVYISIGSAIMSPMIFEKSLSMARNLARQEGRKIKDFMIVVNDIQDGNWDWNSGKEPEKDNPSYYLRFCKSFNRMGARELYYVQADNRDFLLSLYHNLKNSKN